MNCECGNHMVKNGQYKGRQKWRCLACGETFQEDKFHNKKKKKEKEMILKLAARGTTVEAIAYAFGYSRQAVAGFLKKK